MTNTAGDQNGTSKKSGTKQAETALTSVSSGIVTMIIQRTLDKGEQIPVPSLEIILKKEKV